MAEHAESQHQQGEVVQGRGREVGSAYSSVEEVQGLGYDRG